MRFDSNFRPGGAAICWFRNAKCLQRVFSAPEYHEKIADLAALANGNGLAARQIAGKLLGRAGRRLELVRSPISPVSGSMA
jgi:hypothetical protein